jgi:hypothetical protein
MPHKPFTEVVGDTTPEQRARIDEIKQRARADQIAHSLGEVRKIREMTQAELAAELARSQPSVSAMENCADNHISTYVHAIGAMGGRLELVAVFGDQRIVITPKLEDA